MRKEYDKRMNIIFIIIMVVGVLLFAASYFLPAEEDSTSTLSFQSEPVQPVKASESAGGNLSKKKDQAPVKTSNESIEAAKKKAREAIAEEKEEYKFDLHLTDSTDRTVEQLEHDLLAGLNLDENGADASKTGAANKTASNSNAGNANKSKNSGKKGSNNNKKKNAPKNDRYDDLLYVDENSASKEENKTVEDVVKASAGNTNNSGNSGSNKANTGNSNKSQSSKGGKKGKKK